MKNYHAHVYFHPEERTKIEKVHAEATQETALMRVFRIVPFPVGPHATGMFEAHFRGDTRDAVIEWLEKHRQGLSVLIHEDTGDDHRDHSENILWLGQSLPIDFKFFDLVKTDPSRAIHK